MFNSLLATKFHIPVLRTNLVPRHRLTHSLDAAFKEGRQVILVAAPAGFGKTTLITDWLRSVGCPAAWLALDSGDNDPARFWRYVIAAFEMVDLPVAGAAHTLTQSAELPPLELLVTALINDLSAQPAQPVLILDDYHVIENEAVHESLNFFLDHLPANVRLVITTRVDPPLAIARRRSRLQMAEVRSADLRFTLAEVTDYLNQVVGLQLSQEDIAALTHRTEGWVVGLQLAALSLQQQPDRHTFICTFAGDDHYVMDYLVEEVLQRQPPDIKNFLLHTSIVERFCATLCDAVIGINNSQELLNRLEQANLFIFPLDNRRYWYRYHPLFADILRWRFRYTVALEERVQIYRKAARWYESEGFLAEAIATAIAAPDVQEAVRLLEAHALTIFYRSETQLVHQWLKALPADALRASPLLCALYANTIALSPPYPPLSVKTAEPWLSEAEERLHNPERTETLSPTQKELARAFIATFRAFLARYRGEDPQAIIEQSQEAMDCLPSIQLPGQNINFIRFRAALWNNLCNAYAASGQASAAYQASLEAQQFSELCGDLFNRLSSIYFQVGFARRQGRLVEAEELCRQAMPATPQSASAFDHPTPYTGSLYIALGQIYVEWNELEPAEKVLSQGISLLHQTLGTNILAEGYMALARLKRARGDLEGAVQTINQAEKRWVGAKPLADIQRVRIWVDQMQPSADATVRRAACEAAAGWARGRSFPENALQYDPELLALARVQIALSQASTQPEQGSVSGVQTVLRLIEQQIQAAQAGSWGEWLIELYMLQTLALQALGDAAGASSALLRAIALARPGRYLRIFVDERAGLLDLLIQLSSASRKKDSYLEHILAACLSRPEKEDASPSPAPAFLVEPLSPREKEVLRLVANGATNAEIAQHLYITRNTAKKHVLNIFGKLGVSNRVEAILRAQALGILPRSAE